MLIHQGNSVRPTVMPLLDQSTLNANRARNELHSIVLVAGLGLVACFSAWLLWSWTGVVVMLAWIAALYYFAPRVPPEMILRLYRASPLDARNGAQILHIVRELARRADLPAVPQIFVIPSTTLNAFTSGSPASAVIGLTEGMLRRLSMRELAGVLAHELSHIRNGDLAVMALADVMTRFTQVLSYLAVFLFIFNLPALLLGDAGISLSALVLLYLAPSIGSLLQLALSRTREYTADLEGALLTGDPAGLASALEKLEQYQGHFWEDLMLPVPGRRIPQPSLLRTHPETEKRVARLHALEHRQMPPPIETVEEPMVSLVGLGPATMRPRTRWTGAWF
jgi:heat shock protein HtpX